MQTLCELIIEFAQRKEVNIMIANVARAVRNFAGFLLGSIAVAVQISNVLICLAMILFGAGAIINHLPPQA